MKDLLSGHEFFIPYGGIGGKGKGERVLRRAGAWADVGIGPYGTTEEWGRLILLHVILSKPKARRRIRFLCVDAPGCGRPMAAPTGNSGVTP